MATNVQRDALTYFRSGGYITLDNAYAREQLRRLLDAHMLLVEPFKTFVPRLIDDYEYLLAQQVLVDAGVNINGSDGEALLDILARVRLNYRNARERDLLTTILNPIPTNETVLFRVNAGGDEQASDPVWEDDNPGPISYVSGTTQRFSNALTWTFADDVPADAQQQGIPRGERAGTSGNMVWTFDVTGYAYAIARVYVGETFFQAAGQRVFSASVNGTTLFTDLDPYAVNNARGVMMLYEATVQPISNEIVITFVRNIENSSVLALEIIGLS